MFGQEEILKNYQIRESKAISKSNNCSIFKIKAEV